MIAILEIFNEATAEEDAEDEEVGEFHSRLQPDELYSELVNQEDKKRPWNFASTHGGPFASPVPIASPQFGSYFLTHHPGRCD
jgi:hypothetical protein